MDREQELQRLSGILEYFKQLSIDGVSTDIEGQLLRILDSIQYFFFYVLSEESVPEIHRLTVNKTVQSSNKRIQNIKLLKYPPAEKVQKYGRCNMPKQSVLYASKYSLTAIGETKPQIGDLITRSIWRAKEGVELTLYPIFRNQPQGSINPKSKEYNDYYEKVISSVSNNERPIAEKLIQFMADAFSKEVNSNLDYIFSAYFSSVILNMLENGTIDAIHYPSVQQGLSFDNVAIKAKVFDEKYKLWEVQELLVSNQPSNDIIGYFLYHISSSKAFDYNSGQIFWEPTSLPDEMFAELKNQYTFDIT